MLIDTHAHINFNTYKNDAQDIVRRSLDNDVWMINVGSQYSTSKRAVEIAEKYDESVYAAVGLHPIHLETGSVQIKSDPEEIQFKTTEEQFNYDTYRELARHPKVVAIGEIGLDYYWKPKTKSKLELFKEKQKNVLLKQLDLAEELNLPVIFHCRMAHPDLIVILDNKISGHNNNTYIQLSLTGAIHCFTGNWEQAQKYLAMGFYFGFNGLIFKISSEEVIKNLPLEKILVETDAPYLTPPQEEGRNEPIYIKHVASRIAQIKGLSYEKVAEATTQNAKTLFKIDS